MTIAIEHTKSELENLFAQDFSHPTFPQLAEIYLEETDFNRARIVCQTGLQAMPDNIEGQYILAKIELLDNHITKAEKILKDSYTKNVFSEKIIKLLVEIRDDLHRSKHETKKIVDILLAKIPDNSYGNKWIHNYEKNLYKKSSKSQKKELLSHDINFKIDKDLVSITFYNVLKEQKYYIQAAKVLDVLYETKKIKSNFHKIEQKTLNQLSH